MTTTTVDAAVDTTTVDTANDVTTTSSEKLDELIDTLKDQQDMQLNQEDLITSQTEDLKELIDTMSTNVQSLNDTLGAGSDSELTEAQEIKEIALELSNQLQGLSETVQKSSEFVEIGSNAIVTYSIFYIPLAVIVLCLWWFFKQFLTDFR